MSVDRDATVDGHVVTLWREVPDSSIASTAELAALLRQLHSLPVPTEFDIPALDPFAALREFRMTAWLASRLAREPRLKDEADRRIASLRHPDAPRSWTPGT